MPNWCYNNLTIDGNTKGGKILAEAFRPKYPCEDGTLDANPFQDLMPIPEDLRIEAGYFGDGTEKNNEMQDRYARNKEKYGHQHWYDWCIANWELSGMQGWKTSMPRISMIFRFTLKLLGVRH